MIEPNELCSMAIGEAEIVGGESYWQTIAGLLGCNSDGLLYWDKFGSTKSIFLPDGGGDEIDDLELEASRMSKGFPTAICLQTLRLKESDPFTSFLPFDMTERMALLLYTTRRSRGTSVGIDRARQMICSTSK